MIHRPVLVTAPLLSLALGVGCALGPPLKTTGPSVSPEGIEVALTRQRCEQVQEPDQYGWDLIEETLEVRVRNGTTAPLTVQRDAFRLVAPDRTTLSTLTWHAADPLVIPGGDARTFQIRFMTRGGLQCAREMVLDLDAGLSLPGRPVKVGRITFVPRSARA